MYSLRSKIMIIMLACIALISTAFLLYSLFTTANYKRMRLENIENTIAFETEKVNKIIAEIEGGVVRLAQGAHLCYEFQAKELGEALLLNYLRSSPKIVGGGFWYAPYAYEKNTLRAGAYAFFDKSKGEMRLDDTFFMDEYNYHNMSWYREIFENAHRPYDVVWTKPYVDATGSYSLMTTAGTGIFKDNSLVAMATVDWEIDKVIEELLTLTPTSGSYVLLCVPEKDYIISSTYKNNDTGQSLKSLPWDINADSVLINGSKFKAFQRKMNNGWLLSVQVPENEIFEEVERQNNSFSLGILVMSLGMLCLASYLISKQINQPLKQLTAEVSQLGKGNLDVRVKVNTNDELGLLAKTFNKMTVELREAIEATAYERAVRERINTELSLARNIQASMLPCTFPPYPNRSEFDIYATMLPAKEVGGDFYDFFPIGDNNLAVVIADVSGKGVPAALFMVIAKTLIKNNAQNSKSPKAVFEIVNNMLCENNETNMFVTAFMGILEVSSGKFTYVNAGHNPPLIKRAGGSYNRLAAKSNLVLAGMEETSYNQYEITLNQGDMLYMYTDGVTEAANRKNELFTELRLLSVVNQYKDCGLKEFLSGVKLEIDKFADGAEQADDITMLALKMTGDTK